MDRKKVMEMFNREMRVGALSTANRNGDVNTAVFGSPRMIDENTVIMAIGNNRSYQNLQENPKAAFIVVEPGESMATWKGARVYLEVESFERYGEVLDSFREKKFEKLPVINPPMPFRRPFVLKSSMSAH